MISKNSAIGIATDENGDIFFQNEQLQTVQGAEFTAQNINERIDTRYGELALHKFDGLNRYDVIHSNNIDAIASTFKNIILATNTVNTITDFKINKDKKARVLNIEYSANTIFGINISQSIKI